MLGLAGAALLLLGLLLFAAAHESFSRDDFAFLAYVQKTNWSWSEVYFPIEERWWWAYRPLGMQTFFWFGFQLFGMNSFGYFGIAILVHFATGYLAYLLMMRLGFSSAIAMLGALLSISRYPAMRDVLYGAVFHYSAAILFSLLARIAFIDFLRSRELNRQLLSCLFYGLGLLCNEYMVVVPVALLGLAWWEERSAFGATSASRALWRIAPQGVMAAGFLGFRFFVIAPVATHRAYTQSSDPLFIAGNAIEQTFFVFGNMVTLVIAGLVIGIACLFALRSETGRERFRSWLLPLHLLCGVWILVAVTPFATLIVSHARFSRPIELPLCILFAGYLDVLWRALPDATSRRWLTAALVLLAFAALPYATIAYRYQNPLGIYGEGLAETIRRDLEKVEKHSRIVLLYNAPGLASHAGGAKFKRNVFGGTAALQAHFNDKQLAMRLHDLWKSPVARPCERCVFLQLMPGLEVELAEPRFIEFQTPYPAPEESAEPAKLKPRRQAGN